MKRRNRGRLGRLAGLVGALAALLLAMGLAPPLSTQAKAADGGKVLGYFVEWGVYGRDYHVKDIVTSGSAEKLTHINYSFGNVTNGQCKIGDSYAAYDKAYTAAESVDGEADTWDQDLRGNFNQLRKLKEMYPHIKILYSFGGWTWSGGFGEAAANPAAFAESCYQMLHDPRWDGVFDGIDIDWEYPNACGLSCDNSGYDAFPRLMRELRERFGGELVTAAITADASSGGKIDAADYAGAAQYVDWYNVMTYDFFGGFDADGPTAPHSPLYSYNGIPQQGFNSDAAIQKLKGKGIASSKLLLGIGFYGRGWQGVSQSAPGGSASGPAPGTYERGIDDYKVLKSRCPANGTVAGTAYAHCGDQWWSYDTPATITGKMGYVDQQNLGGAFFWELSGDTSNGELITAIANGGDGTPPDPPDPTDPTDPPPTTDPPPGDCDAPAWDSGTVYTGGDRVSHNGTEWEAQWWTQGEEPGTTGEWGVWREAGPCDGDTTPPPTTDPTDPPPTTDPTDPPSDGTWTAGTAYTVGDTVTYNGITYTCRQSHTAQVGWEPPNTPALWQAQ